MMINLRGMPSLGRGASATRPQQPLLSSRVCQLQRTCTVIARSAPSDTVQFEELSDLIKLVTSTDIVEMELKSKRFNISVKKQEALQAAEPIYQMMAPQQQLSYAAAPSSAPAPAPAAPAAAAAPAPAVPATPVGGVEMSSPMSGTYYAAAAPGEPNFVKIGDRVKKGQTVGIIEAMKLMNEIEAELGGEVIKIMVENGKAVTPGQPLMIIKP